MKTQITKALRSPRFHIASCTAMLLLATTTACSAQCAYTNWEGILFGLELKKTNFVAGEPIAGFLTVSNTLDTKCYVPWSSLDHCQAGIGEFRIIELSSGRTLGCVLTPLQRFGGPGNRTTGGIEPHDTRRYANLNLDKCYAITNPGDYAVQGVATWRLLGQPGKTCPAVTPPVFISLATQSTANTNVPPGGQVPQHSPSKP